MTGGWRLVRSEGAAAAFHARDPDGATTRAVWLFRVSTPALVLGSAQPEGHVDLAAARARHVEVARRRSGGGGVLLVPGDVVWADVLVGAGDPLWDDDVGRAAWWVGEVWAAALARLGVAGPVVHRGRLVTTPWSARACFAGLGPGEVTVAGRKVVGVSQRRARGVARFQTAALVHWDAPSLVALLGGAEPAPPPPAAELEGAAVGLDELLGRRPGLDEVEAAFVAELRRR